MQKSTAQEFQQSIRPHILMITNHGVHEWEVIPGLPDTGGQNVFVNQFSEALEKKGYRITIVNRGGFSHPVTGEPRTGIHYKDEHQRILYLDDGLPQFIHKEDMGDRLPSLPQTLQRHIDSEEIPINLIISHYWDGAQLGVLLNRSLQKPIKHVWVPHSLGAVKKRNVAPERWADLRVNERIAIEGEIIVNADGIASTSATIQKALKHDYDYPIEPLFLPPCIDPERYFPEEIAPDDPIWEFLGRYTSLTSSAIRQRLIITEISRTVSTKRKDVLIRAFARIRRKYPQTLLVLTINQDQSLGKELVVLIDELGLSDDVILLGSVWDQLPSIYRFTDIYCTPSIMEGFGMSAQEAAATKIPVIASDKVPFATEYLLGENVQTLYYKEDTSPIQLGEGCVVVPSDEIDGFAFALERLLADNQLRQSMGNIAYNITIPTFTWDMVVNKFLSDLCKSYEQ